MYTADSRRKKCPRFVHLIRELKLQPTCLQNTARGHFTEHLATCLDTFKLLLLSQPSTGRPLSIARDHILFSHCDFAKRH